jgi:hypothetical protein
MVDDRITQFSEVTDPIDSRPNNTSDETDAVAHDQPDNAGGETPVSNTAKCNQPMEYELASLRAEVQHQRDMISTLQLQICSVLATLGIANRDLQPVMNKFPDRPDDGSNNFPTDQKS